MTPISTPPARRDPFPRLLSSAALLVSLIALVFSMGGLAMSQGRPPAASKGKSAASKEGGPHELVRLNAKGKLPASVIPTVPSATNAKKLGGASRLAFKSGCPVSNGVDLGSWCLEATGYKIPTADVGKNDYVYATQKCVEEGGWLPSAAQLIGAAPKVALKSTLDDDPGTADVPEIQNPLAGIKDQREMSADLVTSAAGSAAAGSEGVSAGAKGATTTGEPDPIPMPANPLPATLEYITVFDNHNLGGFAGSEPITAPENFRCAYAKGFEGKPRDVSGRS